MADGEIFSFHLRRVRVLEVPRALFTRPTAPGLRHAESFFTMQLGASVLSPRRYGVCELATLAWWRDEAALDAHLATRRDDDDHWHVRLRLYRRWGQVAEIADAVVDAGAARPGPVVAVTLARLKLSETLRFTRYGRPVERQVRDHAGQRLAFAALRPLATFCTFSIWHDEAAMVGMVRGRDEQRDGASHAVAMRERARRDFHHEFTTMRFTALGEAGRWRGLGPFTT